MLSIVKIRKILRDDLIPEEEVEHIRDHFKLLADIIIDTYISNKEDENKAR